MLLLAAGATSHSHHSLVLLPQQPARYGLYEGVAASTCCCIDGRFFQVRTEEVIGTFRVVAFDGLSDRAIGTTSPSP